MLILINTQSLLSTFGEFEVMLDTYEFNVIARTETWLSDYEHLINHVQISGSNFEYNNRSTGQCGDGVGMHIKDNTNYKRRQDIINIDKSVEHIWIEVPGCNKNNSYLNRCILST